MDYRRLNGVSEFDAYPMPRIDDIIDRLGKAKYISTIDLTRGYWQVPLAVGAQEKTLRVYSHAIRIAGGASNVPEIDGQADPWK